MIDVVPPIDEFHSIEHYFILFFFILSHYTP